MTTEENWPALPYEEWAPTKKTLHMCTQMIGKTRLALAPPQPEWLHACLYLDAHGFTTGPMPYRARTVTVDIDLFDSSLWIRLSDGRNAAVPLGPGRCVAEIWGEYRRTLAGFGIEVDLWEKPQETADTTPFSENVHDCAFVPEHALRFHTVLAGDDESPEAALYGYLVPRPPACETAPIEPRHANWGRGDGRVAPALRGRPHLP